MDGRAVGIAQPRRRLHQRVEYGLQIEGGAADDLEHVSGGGLLLERLAQIIGALAQLVEQPRVLDGYHRLRRPLRQRYCHWRPTGSR
jgi:hypothetical protein